MKKVLVILGPTATGKSDLAIKIALRLRSGQAKKLGYSGAEIISADSRQVYKGLNIGTGKVTKKEMNGIPHHLLDVVEPKVQFSASDFKREASKALDMIYHNSRLPIVVGGTGFYIDTLAGKINLPEVPPNKNLRNKLEKKSAPELFKLLKKKDLSRSKTIDPNNKVRLIRALEIIEALGQVPRNKRQKSKYKFIYIGLKPKDIDERIHARLLKRMPGMIREAKNLLKHKKIIYKRMEELGLEYKYLSLLLRRKLTREEMIDELNKAIKHYAKRQMTWFKRNKKINWFSDLESALKQSAKLLAK